MPPVIAAVIFAIGIAGLFRLDRDKSRVSMSVWIPTIWLFFCLSRSFSSWVGLVPATDKASTYVEGTPVDALVNGVLEILALAVVVARWQRVSSILRKNWPICAFFIYAGLSVAWSDFPFVTLKHWIKGVGDVMMMLIVLSEQNVRGAITRLFSKLAFVLLPSSILFIKYYPAIGRRLTLSWIEESIGVAEQKNGLGELCDILGLVLLWRFRSAYNDRENPNRKKRMVALGTLLAMVMWLLWMCNSVTSISALAMSSVVMLLSTGSSFRRKPALVHCLAAAVPAFAAYALFFQSSGSLVQGLGRNADLTGRTDIWQTVLSIPSHRLLGAGYESFWLGPRLMRMWQAFPGLYLNESHNGYVEILITLGWIGEVLLGILIVTGYQNVIRGYRRDPDLGSLKLAFFLSVVITGFTEAAFRMMGPPWLIFLLATIATPVYAVRKMEHVGRMDKPVAKPILESDVIRDEAPVGY